VCKESLAAHAAPAAEVLAACNAQAAVELQPTRLSNATWVEHTNLACQRFRLWSHYRRAMHVLLAKSHAATADGSYQAAQDSHQQEVRFQQATVHTCTYHSVSNRV
jgi:hypothetical protein